MGAFVFAPLFVISEVIFELGFYRKTFKKINTLVKKEIKAFKGTKSIVIIGSKSK